FAPSANDSLARKHKRRPGAHDLCDCATKCILLRAGYGVGPRLKNKTPAVLVAAAAANPKEALMLYRTAVATAISLLAAGIATAAPPKVVTAPNSDPQCFAPWATNTKMFQYPAKKGPYRIALANGYIATTWRIQMIKTAKAYAAQP